MGEAIDKFLKTSNQAIEDMRAGRYSTMSMTVLHDAVAELATRIQVLEQDSKEAAMHVTDCIRLVREIAATTRATNEVAMDNFRRMQELVRGGG